MLRSTAPLPRGTLRKGCTLTKDIQKGSPKKKTEKEKNKKPKPTIPLPAVSPPAAGIGRTFQSSSSTLTKPNYL